jgi:hypothetical protein
MVIEETRECFLARPIDGPIGEATVAFHGWHCRSFTCHRNLESIHPYTCLVTHRISLLPTSPLNGLPTTLITHTHTTKAIMGSDRRWFQMIPQMLPEIFMTAASVSATLRACAVALRVKQY